MNVDQAEIVLRNLVSQLRKDGQTKASEQASQALTVVYNDREKYKQKAELDHIERLTAELEEMLDQLKSREPSNLYDEQKREITDALFSELELSALEEIKTYYL
jgi:hypothetical protein